MAFRTLLCNDAQMHFVSLLRKSSCEESNDMLCAAPAEVGDEQQEPNAVKHQLARGERILANSRYLIRVLNHSQLSCADARV